VSVRAWVVLLLILANLGYFAWSRGELAIFGIEPARFSESEPQRVAQQIRPQLLKILKDEPAGAPKP